LFPINPRKLKYRSLIFVDKRKSHPRALLFLMGLGELYSLKT
jgi:hypothetical protein